MTLLVIVIALAVENYASVSSWLPTLPWADTYLDYWQKWLGKSKVWGNVATAILMIAPLPILVGIVQLLLHNAFYGAFELLFNLVVLLYCIGPTEVVCTRRSPLMKKTVEVESKVPGTTLEPTAMATTASTVPFDTTLFQQANERVFAVLFWFVVFGAFGAVLYKGVRVVYDEMTKANSRFSDMAAPTLQIQHVLDWLPVRLMGLCFALMGNFTATFGPWLKSLVASPANNNKHLTACGLAALGIQEDDLKQVKPEHGQAATALLERTTVAFVVLVVIMWFATLFA
ncbi:MAG: regulatory signaling modulator protein AmpE [Gammaproteobacteria bacterium]